MEGLKVERLGGENATVESGKTKAKNFTQRGTETQRAQRRVESQRRRILHGGTQRHRVHREEWKEKDEEFYTERHRDTEGTEKSGKTKTKNFTQRAQRHREHREEWKDKDEEFYTKGHGDTEGTEKSGKTRRAREGGKEKAGKRREEEKDKTGTACRGRTGMEYWWG